MKPIKERDITKATIERVSAIDPNQLIEASVVAELLTRHRQPLQHGEAFTGRPSTGIFASDTHVLKLRQEYHFSQQDSRRWIEQKIAKERAWGIYHPAKTWLLLLQQDEAIIASITPRLTPLHIGLDTMTERERLACFDAWGRLYCQFAIEHELRLDEGLSNFAVDEQKQLYYLDDDLYRWDRFMAFSQTVAVWFRRMEWITPEFAENIGALFRQRIMEFFQDRQWLEVIHRQLVLLYLANDAQRERRAGFLRGLAMPTTQRRESAKSQTVRSIIRRPGSDEQIAILADVHSNFQALDAVLKQLKQWNIQSGIVLGDIVGYGPEPLKCIRALQQSGFIVIKGNHDHGLASNNLSKGFSSTGRWVLDWTRDKVDAEAIDWLDNLPPYHQEKNWLAVHGAPQDSTFFNAYVYHMTYESNLDYMTEQGIRLCFHGHTHVQGSYVRQKDQSFFVCDEELDLTTVEYALVCPGSIGQPRSQRVGAEFAIFDQAEQKIRFFRIDYNLDATIAAMNRFEFPEQLITRLQTGN